MSHSPAPGSPGPSELHSALANLNQRLHLLESQPSTSTHVPKVSLPDKFDGHIARFRDFMVSVENVFALQSSRYPTDEIKTRFIGTLLSQDALGWFRDIVEHRPGFLKNYAGFIQEFRELFDDPNAKRHAQAALKRLRQGRGSVLTYSSRFRRLAAETGYNDQALLDLFRSGLNDDVKDVLATSIEEPEDFERFMQFCIRIDQRLYDRRLERGGGARNTRPVGIVPRQESANSGVSPMDLDAMRAEPNRTKRLTEEERRHRLDNGLCLYCGENGHRLATCPSRPSRSPDPSVDLSVTQIGSTLASPSLFLNSSLEVDKKKLGCLALLDSGANANFISLKLVEEMELATNSLSSPLTVRLADGSAYVINKILQGVKLSVSPTDSSDTSVCLVSLLVAPLKFDVVLGTPWLSRVNPLIDWRRRTVSFVTSLASLELTSEPCPSRFSPDIPLLASPACFGQPPPRVEKTLRFATLDVADAFYHVPILDSEDNCVADSDNEDDSDNSDLNDDGGSCDDDSGDDTSSDDDSNFNGSRPPLPPGVPLEYSKFSTVFHELRHSPLPPERSFDLEINLKDPGKTPPFLPIYNLSRKEQQILKEWIDDNLSRGLIRPSSSPSAAPIFFVPKKDGSLRPCIDYRELNSNTVPDGFPLPLISDIMGRFSSAKFFTTLDLRGAYNLIRIKPGCEWKAAFRCQYGLYEPLVVQFGLVNAPSVFQRFILSLFLDLLDVCVVVYLDDILVYSESLEDHTKHVTEVLKRIEENNLVLNSEKCVFNSKSVNYLGHVISDEGVGMTRDKVQALLDFPSPTSVKELRSFLGLANYYRKFLPDFSGKALALTNLTKKGRNFDWDQEAMTAFEDLKSAIAKDVVLRHPCYEKPFEVYTDASDFALGAVLTQVDSSGDLRPVEFYSRKLLDSERNYSVYDKELLAVVEAFQHWRHYLISSPHTVLVHSDHKNLGFFRKAQPLKPRHARWAEFLSQFHFTISHIDGASNAVADAMSRSPTFKDASPSDIEKSEKFVVLSEDYWIDGPSVASLTVLPDCFWIDTVAAVSQLEEQSHEWPEDIALYLNSGNSEWNCEEHPFEDFRELISNFSLLGDRLYHGVEREKRLYLPSSQRRDTLRRFHDGLGHLGSDSILPLLKRRFWWPGFEQSVRQYIANCQRCQLARGQPIGSTYVQSIPPVALPFERWGLDFMQNLPETQNGNRHIITCIDYATRWVVAEAVPEMTTDAVIRFLYKSILMNYGAPFEIITDRGKAFLSEAVQQFESLHHIKHIATTPYHPQTNGMVERMHAMINHALTTLTGSRPNRWDDYLDSTIFAIRVRTHAVTRKSPFFLLYGVDPRLPGDLDPPRQAMSPLSSLEQLEINNEFTARELDQLGQERAASYHRSVAQARRMETSRPTGDTTTHHFEIGDWVKLKNFDKGKFEFRWKGPYSIVELGHPRTYWLMAPDGRRLDSTVNESYLAPWTASVSDNEDFFTMDLGAK
jgi:hypothetical protein